MDKVMNCVRIGLSYFGTLCLGGYIVAMSSGLVNVPYVMGATLSALLAISPFFTKEG